MGRNRIAFMIAAFILVSQYLPGQAVFAEETVTGLDGVAAVAANDRYSTFEHSLTLSPEGTYCYRVRLNNLSTKAEERILFVQLPLGFENATAELAPRLVKIKALPKAEKEGVINVSKSDQVFQPAAANELPGGKFNYYGDVGGAAVIRLDLTGLKFKGSSHDFDFILQAPNFAETLEPVEAFKHGFYLFEKNQGEYKLAAAVNNPAQVHYETLSEAYLTAENAIYSENGEKEANLELQPGDFYNYKVKIKKPLRKDVGSRILLVAVPAFYGNLDQDAYPKLFQEDWLKTEGLAFEALPVSFTEVTFNGGPGDASEQPFMVLENKNDIIKAAMLKIDLSSVQFTGNEACLEFCFKVPDYPSLASYPEKAQWKDMALHGYALYEFDGEESLVYKKPLGVSLQKARINQNPLIMQEAPYPMEAEDGLSLSDEKSISVYGRTIQVIEGEKYEYQISLTNPHEYDRGYESFLYVNLPEQSTVLYDDISAEGLDITDGVFYATNKANPLKGESAWTANGEGEVRAVRVSLDSSRFSGEKAVVTIPLLAPKNGEASYAEHNFVMSAVGRSGDSYIFTNEKNNLALAGFVPAAAKNKIIEEETGQMTAPEPVQSGTGALYGGVEYGRSFPSFDTIEQETDELQNTELQNTASEGQYLRDAAENQETSNSPGIEPQLETKSIEGVRPAPEQSSDTVEAPQEETDDQEGKNNPKTYDFYIHMILPCIAILVLGQWFFRKYFWKAVKR